MSNGDSLGTLRWQGVDGIIVPSEEGYGVIFTADATRMVITVPFEAMEGITKETPESEARIILQPMFSSVINMLNEMEEESRGPE